MLPDTSDLAPDLQDLQPRDVLGEPNLGRACCHNHRPSGVSMYVRESYAYDQSVAHFSEIPLMFFSVSNQKFHMPKLYASGKFVNNPVEQHPVVKGFDVLIDLLILC